MMMNRVTFLFYTHATTLLVQVYCRGEGKCTYYTKCLFSTSPSYYIITYIIYRIFILEKRKAVLSCSITIIVCVSIYFD